MISLTFIRIKIDRFYAYINIAAYFLGVMVELNFGIRIKVCHWWKFGCLEEKINGRIFRKTAVVWTPQRILGR
tara:strand:- start:1259 stop:1477 length:219 start_codon:yes stop_codon:yes gene_type:complete